MDFESIFNFFKITNKEEINIINQESHLSELYLNNVEITDVNPNEVFNFAENFKSLNLEDESALQTPANSNIHLNDWFVYQNDDITAIDLESISQVEWNNFLHFQQNDDLEPINNHKKSLDIAAQDILDQGNNIMFSDDEFASLNFTDEGWTHIEHVTGKGEETSSYDLYLHTETGAMIQADISILTYLPMGIPTDTPTE